MAIEPSPGPAPNRSRIERAAAWGRRFVGRLAFMCVFDLVKTHVLPLLFG